MLIDFNLEIMNKKINKMKNREKKCFEYDSILRRDIEMDLKKEGIERIVRKKLFRKAGNKKKTKLKSSS